MAAPPGLADAIRALYLGPLGEFRAGRQALAKGLRQAGDAREREVKALSKPALSAWAVNQLFARERQAMTALARAGERARASQRRGDPATLRETLATIRAETARLAERGVEVLTAADRAPGEAIVGRLRANLEALALNPTAAAVAARGWHDVDLEAPAFEVVAALQLAASEARTARVTRGGPAASQLPGARAPQARHATVHRLDDERAAVTERREREARRRRERLEQLAAELARAEAEAMELRHMAERAAQAAEQAVRDAAEAAKRAEGARRTAQQVGEGAASAEAALARAREALARAEQT